MDGDSQLVIHGVANTAGRADRVGVAQFGANLRDVHVDRAPARVVDLAPDAREQFLAGEHATGRAREFREEIELGAGQRDRRFVRGHPATLEVDRDAADGEQRGRHRPALATKQGLEPGNEFTRGERLGQVIVGTELDAEDAVDLVVAGGDEDDGRPVAGFAQAPTDLDAVQARKSDIEDHGDGPQPPNRGEAGGTVTLDVHAEARLGEVQALQVGYRALVFDDNYQTPRVGHGTIQAHAAPESGVGCIGLTFPEHCWARVCN